MSFYNMICGSNPAAGRLLLAIGLDPHSIPRLRDVYADKSLTEITVYTRTGGNNRETYEAENGALRAHPLYLRDVDDDFDSTFAHFLFRFPVEEREKFVAELDEALKDEWNGEKQKAAVMAMIVETPREKLDRAMEALKRT